MDSCPKCVAANFQAIGEEFLAIVRGAAGRTVEEVASDYQDAAQRAGDLLIDACQCQLLQDIPDLAKLVAKDANGARLFRDFHGYEVNAGVLLPLRPDDHEPRHAAITCGLLPKLFPDDPVFHPHRYDHKDAERQAMTVNLVRAAAACRFLAMTLDEAASRDGNSILPLEETQEAFEAEARD